MAKKVLRPSKARRKVPGNTAATVTIASIKIGKRFRVEPGDVASLAASMDDIGLLHPVVTRRDGTLIVGARRIAAATKLGWKTIPATVIDLDDILRGEFAENAHRKNFTMSENVAIADALEAYERKAAKARQAAAGPSSGRGRKATGSVKFYHTGQRPRCRQDRQSAGHVAQHAATRPNHRDDGEG